MWNVPAMRSYSRSWCVASAKGSHVANDLKQTRPLYDLNNTRDVIFFLQILHINATLTAVMLLKDIATCSNKVAESYIVL